MIDEKEFLIELIATLPNIREFLKLQSLETLKEMYKIYYESLEEV